MEEGTLERRLRSIGKECFVTFFEQFRDPSLSNEQVASLSVGRERLQGTGLPDSHERRPQNYQTGKG